MLTKILNIYHILCLARLTFVLNVIWYNQIEIYKKTCKSALHVFFVTQNLQEGL